MSFLIPPRAFMFVVAIGDKATILSHK
jgi:hypothetical protein